MLPMPSDRPPIPGAGLCATCRHLQEVPGKNRTFLLCRLSFTNERFPKYPPLPVLSCDGYERGENASR